MRSEIVECDSTDCCSMAVLRSDCIPVSWFQHNGCQYCSKQCLDESYLTVGAE